MTPSPRDPAQFTRESADRIAAVVRSAELTPPSARPLRFDPLIADGKQKVFRMCTFTGAWPKGSAKTVTFRGVTSTPNTASATNLFAAVPAPASSGNCAIAKDGTAWYLIAAECD